MTSELLRTLRADNASIWPLGDQLHFAAPAGVLTPELRQAIAAAKPDLLAHLESEVAWRMENMRQQASRVVEHGYWPLLVAKPGPVPAAACLSCSEPLMAVEHSRCALCLEAVRRTMGASK